MSNKVRSFTCTIYPKGHGGNVRIFLTDGSTKLFEELSFQEFNAVILMLSLKIDVYWSDEGWLTTDNPENPDSPSV
jgi:hypothetical protein